MDTTEAEIRPETDEEQPECPKSIHSDGRHSWRFVRDWMGDPNVINGTCDCSYWTCDDCGEERPA